MDVKVSKKIDSYLREFKLNIAKKINELELASAPNIDKFVNYVYEASSLLVVSGSTLKVAGPAAWSWSICSSSMLLAKLSPAESASTGGAPESARRVPSRATACEASVFYFRTC